METSNHRYFNVIGSDPEGRLGEAPRLELRSMEESLVLALMLHVASCLEHTTKPPMELAYEITLISLTWLMVMLKLSKKQNPLKSESTVLLVPGKVARCKSLLRRARKRLALRSRSITCLDAKVITLRFIVTLEKIGKELN
ncbi:unnamed protein product [Eruca vesicaria subsp. sativa]|uniref:Uncharacterized protein n=1 Tax=Eruca vesicaria subsp. sativa TaxID=29727 RepID=A0ABC8LPJ7_ERUVS|nr:unnamed protein product [Eruca vesicaria subsp. sativa]